MEVKHIKVDVEDTETGYLQLTPVVAEVIKIVKSDQGYSLIALRDFAGEEIVALIRGRVRPGRNDIGIIAVFGLSGQTKGNKIQYAGFYNPKDDIPTQYQGKRPPKPAGEASGDGSGGSGGSGKGNGKGTSGGNRGYALSYAKDLACAGAITVKQLQGVASLFTTYLDTGSWGVKPASKPAEAQPARITQPEEDQEIPETGQGNRYDNEAGAGYTGSDDTVGDTREPITETYPEGAFEDTPF